jgi:hypothetical protein
MDRNPLCPDDFARYVWGRYYCGRPGWFDRDCLSSQVQNTLSGHLCNAKVWMAMHPARYVEIWDEENDQVWFRMRNKGYTAADGATCYERARRRGLDQNYGSNPDDRFTINIPGLQDIFRIPDLESKDLRRQRYKRWMGSRSALPEGLQWIPPLLNKLDDAQDLLYTALVLAKPILKRLGAMIWPPLGIALVANDVLNGAS